MGDSIIHLESIREDFPIHYLCVVCQLYENVIISLYCQMNEVNLNLSNRINQWTFSKFLLSPIIRMILWDSIGCSSKDLLFVVQFYCFVEALNTKVIQHFDNHHGVISTFFCQLQPCDLKTHLKEVGRQS